MTVDLSYARQHYVELVMGDECIIDHSDLGPEDWVMNETTLEMTVPDGSSTQVYDGICLISWGKPGAVVAQDAGLLAKSNQLTIELPWDEGNDIEIGDYVTVTLCRDPTREGAHLRVTHVARDGLLITRELQCEMLESNRAG